MNDMREAYSNAAERAVTEGERHGLWPAWGYYRVEEDPSGDAIAVAPRAVPGDHKPDKRENNPISVRVEKKDGGTIPLRRYNRGKYYAPLLDYPDLFQKFARLGGEGGIGREAWLKWLYNYGVLGALPGNTGQHQRDEVSDSFLTFAEEAALANRTQSLFGAVASPTVPDAETIRELLSGEYQRVGNEPDQLRRAGLLAVRDFIEQKVRSGCYQRLVLRNPDAQRSSSKSPFARQWGFSSLLAAMWLQFEWLTTSDSLRFCTAPGCSKPIPPNRRSDAKTCSDSCRQALSRALRS